MGVGGSSALGPWGRVRGWRGRGLQLPPAKALRAFCAYFCQPLPASPQTRNSRGEPSFRGRGPPRLAASPLPPLVRQSRVMPPPRPAPHGHGAATRGGERREGPSAPDVEDVQRDARPRGDFAASPPPFRRRREWPPCPPPRPRPGPDAAARRCRGARQPMGSEEVGRRAAVTLPGTGARRLGAREPRPRPGRGGGAGGWEEEPPSSSPRTTAPQAAEDRPGRTPYSPRPRPPA